MHKMQHLQSAIPPQVCRLPIAKFSHTTTLFHHVAPLNWTHVTGNGDLFCIFEKIFDSGSAQSKLIQKVLHGDEVLEQVELLYFIQRVAFQAQSIPPPKSHFAVVVKSPCIAVKYPRRETIRRFQLKFTTEHDYSLALSLLGEVNCPLAEGNTQVPAIRRFPSVSSLTSGDLSSVALRTSRTMAASHSNNGVHFDTEALESGGTTPVCASSPASTVSYPMSMFGPPLPTINRSTLGIKSMGVKQSLSSGPVPFPDISLGALEVPSSQLSAVSAVPGIHDVDQLNQMLPPKRDLPFSKPATKKLHASAAAKETQDPPGAQCNVANKDPGQLPRNVAMEPDNDLDLFRSQSQKLSQPEPFSQASQPFLLHEEPPISSQVPSNDAPVEQEPQTPGIQTTLLAHDEPRNSNIVNMSNDKQEHNPEARAAPASTKEQLREYLASPTSERIAFLENWMCELIEDDEFMTLCQDVEGTWRRFAFGQKP